MKQCGRVPWEALLLGLGTAFIPLWPDFISLASVAPPGVSIIPVPAVVGVLMLCIIASAAIVIRCARERSSPPALAGPIAAYTGSWILASMLGFDIATGLLMVLALCMATAFHVGICAWYDRRYVACTIYATLFITGTIASLLGIAMVLLKRPVMLYALVHGRAVSTFVVPGEFAAYLLLLVSTALGVVLTIRSAFLFRLGIAALVSGSVALGMTYSRAGWLGAAAGTAFFLYVQCRRSGKSRGFAALLGAAPIVVLLVVAKTLFHGHHNPSEDFVRLPIWSAGLRAIELFPLTGTGPGSFRHLYPSLRPITGEPAAFHVHNVLLTALAETGMLGAATLCALWLRFIGIFRDRLREAKPPHRTLALAIATGFVATWAQGMLDFVQVVVLGCWLPFMALALATVERGVPES